MEHSERILVVEDDRNIRNFICTILRVNGYESVAAENGAQAMTLATSQCPELVLLDMGLPDMDGKRIIEFIRSWSSMPIIVVSARTLERDKVETLDLGADDYLTKPFGPSELMARIRAALRHSRAGGNEGVMRTGRYEYTGLTVDYGRRRVYLDGEDVGLTQAEYRIVALLGKYAGRVVTYDRILREIWGPGAGGSNQILRVNMANIRRKLREKAGEPQYIFTEIGVGYRMAAEDD